MDFLSKGTRRSVNLSAFLQQVLKAEQCNFLGENQSGTGANQKIYSTHVPLLRGTVNVFTFGGAKRSGSDRECKYFPIGMNAREPLWR